MRQKRWPDASNARCEQSIMLGFYSIRKLMESGKLTDEVVTTSVRVRSHSSKGQVVHRMNSHKLDELYDWDSPEERTVLLQYVCNQVVHSYVFGLLLGEDGGLQGILVTSDRRRSKELLEIRIEEIIGIFERVGKDNVRSMKGRFDEAKGDYVFSRKKT